jgi:hypothetical protein
MRTGSSLATRALVLLGADPGEERGLMEGTPNDNPKGFWEQRPLVDLNDELLARLGGPWWDVPRLSSGWHDDPGLEPLRQRARTLIGELFPSRERWIWKDPRASVTLPFWQDVIGPMRYILCTRSPVEVAASLHARDPVGHPRRESTRLFFRYLRDGVRHSADADRIVIFYEDWFDDFDAQLERLAEFANGAAPSERATSAVREFFEAGLRHHESANGVGELDPELRAAWELLRGGTSADGRLDPDAGRLIEEQWLALEGRIHDEVSEELRARSRAYSLLAHARQAHLEDLERAYENVNGAYAECAAARRDLEARHAEMAAELDQANRWLQDVSGSVSWRITAPLRRAKRLASRR